MVAIVALAPEIAFKTKLQLPKEEVALTPFWIQTSRLSQCRSPEYNKYIDILVRSSETKEQLEDAWIRYYDAKRKLMETA